MIVIPNMQLGYRHVLDVVLSQGQPAFSRGHATTELLGQQIILEDPLRSYASNVGRGLVGGIAWVEAMQLIAGETYPQLMCKIAPNFERFKNGDVHHGAYGPRVRPQMEHVIRRLTDDRGSRQAIVTLWDPMYDNQDDRRDLPCTLNFQFMIRDGVLIMITNMRSNDVWLGLPYDIFQFTMLQKTLANVLGVKSGFYVHNVGSLHIYDKDIVLTDTVTDRAGEDGDVIYGFQPAIRESAVERWETVRTGANLTLQGEMDPTDHSSILAVKAMHRV